MLGRRGWMNLKRDDEFELLNVGKKGDRYSVINWSSIDLSALRSQPTLLYN